MIIYSLRIKTGNPLATSHGLYSSREKAKAEIKRWEKKIEDDIANSEKGERYYADSLDNCFFEIEMIVVDQSAS